MAQQEVTELIVRADGALANLDKFEGKMVDAGKATDQSTGAIDAYNAALSKAAAAQEKGLAIMTQRVERLTADQRAMERWQGTVDPMMRLEIKLRREAQRAAVDMANAVILGYTSQEKALVTLTALERQHASQLAEAATEAQRLAGVQAALGSRVDATTRSIGRQNDQIRRNSNSFNTANIAAQLQDIGVTTAMGMSPIQIALQQGTQLSAVFEQMKSSGQSAGAALGAAFASIVSPVSLVTIGVIAATAAAAQWYMEFRKGGADANTILKEHSEWLGTVLAGYESAEKAAKKYIDEAARLPKAAAESDLAASQRKSLEDYQKKLLEVKNFQTSFLQSYVAEYERVANKGTALKEAAALQELQRQLSITNPELDVLIVGLTEIKNTTASVMIRKVAEEMLAAALAADAFSAKAHATKAAIDDLDNITDQFKRQLEEVSAKPIRDELEKIFGKAREGVEPLEQIIFHLAKLEQANPSFQGIIDGFRELITKAYETSVALDTLRPGGSGSPNGRQKLPVGILPDTAPVPEARPNAEDVLAKAEKAADKAAESYDRLVDSAQRRVDQLRVESEVIGKAASDAEAYRMEQDMLLRAVQAGVDLDSKAADGMRTKRQEIHDLTEQTREYLRLIAEGNLHSDLMFERAQLGRSDVEQRVAEGMRRLYGDDYPKYMDSALAGEIRLNEAIRKTREELDDVNDAVKDTFVGLIDLLYQSGDATEKLIGAFAQLGKMFAAIGAEKLYDFISGKSSSLFGGSVPSVGGSASVANYRASGQAIGETIAPPIVDSLNSGLDTYAAAIRKIESGSYGGNYGAQGQVVTSGMYAGDRAYGAYQIMGNNIASWTKEVLGQSMTISQFLGDKMAQDKVFYAKFGQSVDKYGSVADAISVWFSGRPLSRAGNASDGYNTVPEYVSKVQSAADAYPGGLPKAVSDGMVDATKRIRVGNNFQDTYDVAAPGSVAGQGGMTKMQGLLGVGGAAFGAFAGGYQSGDPISGAIGGAMAGLGATSSLSALGLGAAAGPVGIIGGAIIGLIGGLLGKAKQKKQEMKQAQQELESQMGAITQLIATATGNFMGSFEKSFTSTTDEFQKAIALAEKAGNKVMVEKLKSSMDEFFGTLQDQWDRGFEGVLASMNAGLGFDGEFVKGSDAVEKMRESLVGFVNDAKFFAEAQGDLSSMLDARKNEYGIGTTQQTLYRYQPQYREAGSEGSWVDNELTAGYLDIANQMVDLGVAAFTRAGGQLYPTLEALKRAATDAGLAIDEQGKVTRELKAANDNLVDSVERAREGAQATALAMLSGGKEFTEVEKAIQRLEGAAATLPSLLDDLGMSAEEAAKAIEHHLNIALRDLRNNLTTDLTRSINDLAGFGYLNDLLDAQTAYQTHLQELEALGMDTGLAMQELGLRLANIAKEAELTDDQLTQLAAVFPQLGGSLLGLIGAGSTGTAAAVADAKAKLDDAKADLRRAYEEEASRLNQVISKHEAYIKSLQKFKDDLKLDSNLSPYDPYQRLQEAQRQFQETATAALGGDEDALGRIEDVSRSYLEEARSYYGTSEAYFSIFNDVQSLLDQALAVSNSSLSEAQQQLAALKEQTSALIDIDDSVMSVADAVAALAAAEAANAAAIAARDAQQAQLFQQMLGLLQQTGQAYDPFVSSLYRDVLGRAPDAEGAAYYTNMLNSGMSQDAVRAQFVANAQPELARGYPLYAGGGDFGGGLRIVGERGPELEMTGPSRIWSASDTSRILSQAWQAQSYGASNDNSWLAVVKELQAVKAELAGLRAERNKGDSIVAAGAQATAAAARETSQAVRDQTKAARLERRQKVA